MNHHAALTVAIAHAETLREQGFVEGELSVEPGWYLIWSASDVSVLNQQYALSTHAPDYAAFGSSGGGELLVANQSGQVFSMPAVGIAPEHASLVAANIVEFKLHMRIPTLDT